MVLGLYFCGNYDTLVPVDISTGKGLMSTPLARWNDHTPVGATSVFGQSVSSEKMWDRRPRFEN
jgi:hypothetical protein